MSHRIFTLALAVALAFASTARADLVTDWNLYAVQLTKDAKLGPNPATRVLAVLHIAVHDAIASIDKTYAPYTAGLEVVEPISREAAALAAAKVTHEIQTFPARHGFCVPDAPTFDASAAERHYEVLKKLFAETL